ncbi:hypothetical protein [Enterococcus faecium]|uniref:hypothetical protein n=1 Tax=Enterococcus faecium TaxID=1352 RepID=UPI000330A7F7|nr:hypothetical protein [Enterococcus faecium]EOM66628.1 hypothetical protein SK9_01828 [Enterococcus faecium EnGen0163]
MKVDKGDKVVCNCKAWGIIAEIGVVTNVLEGKENKYVVELKDGYSYLLRENEIAKL